MGMGNAEMQTIKELTQGNPGALSVCMKLRESLGYMAAVDFALLKMQHISGTDLWQLYTYVCKGDIKALHTAIGAGQGPALLKAIPGSSFWSLEQAARASRMVADSE